MSNLMINEGGCGNSVFYKSIGGANIEVQVCIEKGIGQQFFVIDKCDAIKIIKHLKEQLNITDEQIKGEEHE